MDNYFDCLCIYAVELAKLLGTIIFVVNNYHLLHLHF